MSPPSLVNDSEGGVLLDTSQSDFVPTQPAEQQNAEAPNPERAFVWIPGAESSHNMGTTVKFSPLAARKLPPTGLVKGQLTREKCFTPIVALSKFPYKYCGRDWSQKIATAFFDQGKFWAREWDLYYLWDVRKEKPLVLVAEKQVQDLFKEINSELKLNLKITRQQREEGFVNQVPNHPYCTPRYLGRSLSREDYDTLTADTPEESFQLPGEPDLPSLDSDTMEEWQQMIEDMYEAQKNKTKRDKEKKKVERFLEQKAMADQFKRIQRYLGLRPPATNRRPKMPLAIDNTLPLPYPFDRSVVFVCVDVEAWERDHQKITEVGIATLDTRVLVKIAPGVDGKDWRSKIRARHFRIKENAHLVNSEFVSGCPDRFYFGKSELISAKDAPSIVSACFHPPFSARPSEDSTDDVADLLENVDLNEQRNIIYLGHSTQGDTTYLQQLGFNPLELTNIVETLDSAKLYRVWHRDMQATKLGNILYDFDIPGFSLHNAGNDAVYTVQAMLAILVREASIRGSIELKEMRREQKEDRMELAAPVEKKRIQEELEGWEIGEAE